MAAGKIHVLGATAAVTKTLFTNFPPIDDKVRHEDRVLPFRALLLGGEIILVDKRLVRYRTVGGVSRIKPRSGSDFLRGYC